MARYRGTFRTAVVAGLGLLLVPTFFTVFPAASRWSPLIRVPVLVIWVAVAARAALSEVRQGRQIDDLVGPAIEERTTERVAAAQIAIEAVLANPPAGFEPYELRLFAYDVDRGRLRPVREPDKDVMSEGWEVGQGATGTAYAQNQLVTARQPAVSDGSYGLTREQQRRYSGLAIVVAIPVRNAREHPIGVLTASGDVDDGFFDTETATDGLVVMAQVCARLLIDLWGEGAD